MGLLNFWKKKTEKRQVWYPWAAAISSQKSTYLSGDLPQVSRCLQIYKNLVLATPLVAVDRKTGKETNHYLLDVIQQPAKYMTFSQWVTRLVENWWLEGNAYFFIETEGTGKVTGLLPFPAGTIYCYAQGRGQQADHSNPIELNREGAYVYRSQFKVKGENGQEQTNSAVYSPESILHFKRQFQSQGDLLNGPSLYEAYTEAVNMTGASLDTSHRFAKNGMTPPLLLTGAEGAEPEVKAELKEALEDFYESQKNALTLPEGIEVSPVLPGSNPANFLVALSSIGSLNISRLFSVPSELLGSENFATQHAGPAVREIFRFFVRTAGRAFLKEVAEGLSTLSTEVRFKFLVKSVLGSDLRETGQTVKGLVEAGMSKENAEEYLQDND